MYSKKRTQNKITVGCRVRVVREDPQYSGGWTLSMTDAIGSEFTVKAIDGIRVYLIGHVCHFPIYVLEGIPCIKPQLKDGDVIQDDEGWLYEVLSIKEGSALKIDGSDVVPIPEKYTIFYRCTK